jgi:hypothetical protein
MAEHNSQHRRPHFHRGRRGADRRGTERRSPQRDHAPESTPREAARDNNVDVEQIMREIRSRIAQRHGIDLSAPQIQELAARRLDAILEPRNIKPQLLEQLRKAAGSGAEIPDIAPVEHYEFDETTLYETHRGVLRFFRKLLHPILKLFFNPTPLINALRAQTRINKELAARELERERRQSEWNALQFELVRRVVVEASRISIEMQALSSRIESLGAKVDFNERRVRGLETAPAPGSARPPQRQPHHEAIAASAPSTVQPEPAVADGAATADGAGDGTRKRRRRRRGRRGGGGMSEQTGGANAVALGEDDLEAGEGAETDDDEVVSLTAVDVEVGVVAVAFPPSTLDANPEQPLVTPAPVRERDEQPAAPPSHPTPPRDEPTPADPVDHADPGPIDR